MKIKIPNTMKNLITILFLFISFVGFSQTKVKPSEMSTATKAAFVSALNVYTKPQADATFLLKSAADIIDALDVRGDTITGIVLAPTSAVGTNTTQLATTEFVMNSNLKYFNDIAALGFTNWKIWPIGLYGLISGATLTDNTGLHVCFYVRTAITVSTVNCIMTTKGDYTADNYNGIGLYGLNLTDGTMTKITETIDDGNIWKANANTIISKSWPTPQTLAAGVYVVKILYNNSAQVTAPAILSCTYGVSGALTALFPNGIKMMGQKGSTNTLPTSEAMSTVSAGTNVFAIWMN